MRGRAARGAPDRTRRPLCFYGLELALAEQGVAMTGVAEAVDYVPDQVILRLGGECLLLLRRRLQERSGMVR